MLFSWLWAATLAASQVAGAQTAPPAVRSTVGIAPFAAASARDQWIAEGFAHVDVLSDPDIREGIKAYGSWPTIPQLYVRGELIGGSDIIEAMLNSGELHALFGQAVPDRSPPTLHITARAAEAIRAALADSDASLALHMTVDPRFNAQFQLRPAQGSEIVAEASGTGTLRHPGPATKRAPGRAPRRRIRRAQSLNLRCPCIGKSRRSGQPSKSCGM